ncbi:nicotinate-nucleotide pyrophosphorylase [Desulfoscipio geothermicus]|uniref:Nicotinate-nucleotide pyrophosphorylase (Carboxylating) n=1 Tax=Desulfoscipio geothermicus DSM 3669 TaxID=1121426 RepID=A0A1I6DQW9_9FIRM|nr:nicotinate-nucleotide pyrophosphorylase [Desulfoscipio geothermicus]SFR07834.1 nicotinate-nucleotide pyrophosphorylase (carboxylating) [Desulfoscipio geothermicus DSM 3669]
MEKCILPSDDLRWTIFHGLEKAFCRAEIVPTHSVVAAGMDEALQEAEKLELQVRVMVQEGEVVLPGSPLLELVGTPVSLAVAEDRISGWIGKASGVATAAHFFSTVLSPRVQVVCGGWKKLPLPWRFLLRRAASLGGLDTRIAEPPFIYLDKNYVRMLGGIAATLKAVAGMPGQKIIQLKGEWGEIAAEAELAIAGGAHILMVDTGMVEDVVKLSTHLRKGGWREKVRLAFAGGVTERDLPLLLETDLDVIDVGRAVLDAPMADLRFEVRGRV